MSVDCTAGRRVLRRPRSRGPRAHPLTYGRHPTPVAFQLPAAAPLWCRRRRAGAVGGRRQRSAGPMMGAGTVSCPSPVRGGVHRTGLPSASRPGRHLHFRVPCPSLGLLSVSSRSLLRAGRFGSSADPSPPTARDGPDGREWGGVNAHPDPRRASVAGGAHARGSKRPPRAQASAEAVGSLFRLARPSAMSRQACCGRMPRWPPAGRLRPCEP
jgi:hypothetical protein